MWIRRFVDSEFVKTCHEHVEKFVNIPPVVNFHGKGLPLCSQVMFSKEAGKLVLQLKYTESPGKATEYWGDSIKATS